MVHVQSEMMNNQLIAPTKIPKDIKQVAEKEAPPSSFGVAGAEGLGGSAGGVMGSVFGSGSAPKVQAAPPKKVNISAGVAQRHVDPEDHADVSADCQSSARFRHGRYSGDDFETGPLRIFTWSVVRRCCSKRPWML